MPENRFYKIEGIPGLEGLTVRGDHDQIQRLVIVRELINTAVVIGDRNLKYPIPLDSDGYPALTISDQFLRQIEDPGIREFASDNPFGEFLFEGKLVRDTLVVVYSQYTKGLSITISEEHKAGQARTLYAQNFFGDKSSKVMQAVSDAMRGTLDIDDLVFSLKALEMKEG